jgi:hypothetical protein
MKIRKLKKRLYRRLYFRTSFTVTFTEQYDMSIRSFMNGWIKQARMCDAHVMWPVGIEDGDFGKDSPVEIQLTCSFDYSSWKQPNKNVVNITSKEQFIEFYGSPDMPHTPLPVDVLQDLVVGPAGELYGTRVKGDTPEEPYVAPLMAALKTSPGERVASPEYGSDIGKWLAEGSAEIVPGSHGTYSIIDATRKEK